MRATTRLSVYRRVLIPYNDDAYFSAGRHSSLIQPKPVLLLSNLSREPFLSDFIRAPDDPIGLVLDFPYVLLAKPLEVRYVKSDPVNGLLSSCLPYVGAQNPSSGSQYYVRCRVVDHELASPLPVYDPSYLSSLRKRPINPVDHVSPDLKHVKDGDPVSLLRYEESRVMLLSSSRWIERSLIEYY